MQTFSWTSWWYKQCNIYKKLCAYSLTVTNVFVVLVNHYTGQPLEIMDRRDKIFHTEPSYLKPRRESIFRFRLVYGSYVSFFYLNWKNGPVIMIEGHKIKHLLIKFLQYDLILLHYLCSCILWLVMFYWLVFLTKRQSPGFSGLWWFHWSPVFGQGFSQWKGWQVH